METGYWTVSRGTPRLKAGQQKGRNKRRNTMNVNEYMERDFQLLDKRIDDVRKAYEQRDPSRTMSQASEMFDAFQNRFALEDFLLSKVHPTPSMKAASEKFLIQRRRIRELLEDMLMMHVSEPDFIRCLRRVGLQAQEHLHFLSTEFYPQFVDQMSEGDRKNIAHALEDRFHIVAL
jgi:hypothetical protein